MIIDASAINGLDLVQLVDSNMSGHVVEHSLILQDTVRGSMFLQSVDHSLLLRGISAVDRKIINLSLSDALSLISTPTHGSVGITQDFIGLYQRIKVWGDQYQIMSSMLTLSQAASATIGKPVRNVLTLTNTVTVNSSKAFSVSSTLGLTNSPAFYIPKTTFTLEEYPTFDHKPTFIYGTDQVVLRSPDFNNGEKFGQTRILRRNRAGDLIIFRDNQWPGTQTINLTYSYLKPEQASKLLSFMRMTMGKTVTYIDHESRQWSGYIMTPAAQVAEQMANNFTVSIEFQGMAKPMKSGTGTSTLSLAQTTGETHP